MTLVADFNSSVNVPFQRMRQQQLDGALQAGVVGASDFMVVQRGAGANQSVDVGAGFAWVRITTGTRNGMGHVTNDATANVTVTASNGTNPRIDRILLRWNDTSIPTGAGNVPTLEVLTGTATAGATLNNLTGAAAVPNDCLLLADLLIPTSSTTISNTQIRDRRPWARGAHASFTRTATNLTTTNAAYTNVDGTNWNWRIECSGVPIIVTFTADFNVAAAATLGFGLVYDGGTALDRIFNLPSVSQELAPAMQWRFTPAAGSHTFLLQWKVSTGTGTIFATPQPSFSVEEIVRQNTANNTTTSG